MSIEADVDWVVRGPLAMDGHYHRVHYLHAELRDFGRDVGIVVGSEYPADGKICCMALSRVEAQRLFDKLWEFYFRPTEKKDGVVV